MGTPFTVEQVDRSRVSRRRITFFTLVFLFTSLATWFMAALIFEIGFAGSADAGAQSRDPLPTAASSPTTSRPDAPAAEAVPAAPAMFAHPVGRRYFIAGQANRLGRVRQRFASGHAEE